jgi:hypothetical protein
MMTSFLASLQSERLKLKRSLLGWLVLAGGLFVPVIMLGVRLHQRQQLAAQYRAGTFWEKHWTQSWESISILILPLMIILIATLIVQVEYRNNTWKQLHASPQALVTIFLAKLSMVLSALLLFFVVLNAGLYLAGSLPVHFVEGVSPAASPIPYRLLLARNARFFVDCLPVVALQYLLALRCKNFLVPVGVGTAGWISSLVLINTPYCVVVPYGYAGVDYLFTSGYREGRSLPLNLQALALGTFAVFSLAAYGLYATRKDRGS